MFSGMQINAESATPIYFQISEQIKEDIRCGKLKQQDMLPPDRVFCEELNVSRMTVKKAIDLLANEGLVVRKKGIGTFVASPKIVQSLYNVTGFTGDNARRGAKVYSRVIAHEVIPVPPEVAEKLKLKKNQKVIRLKRLRFVNDEPVALETSYLNYAKCRKVMDYSFEEESLYRVLSQECHITLETARQTIEVAGSTEGDGLLLKNAIGNPMFYLSRTSCDPDGTPIEYVKSVYRSDRYIFEIYLEKAGEKAKGD